MTVMREKFSGEDKMKILLIQPEKSRKTIAEMIILFMNRSVLNILLQELKTVMMRKYLKVHINLGEFIFRVLCSA